MEVTHVQDHVTHAVISGAQAINFGISDSPEFFNILSSTLYSDQVLAVVRETLCNAWDAHIEFNCEDVPVEITLDEKYVTIRDFGPGIAPNMMGPIYGTYGGSTKKANGEVTGGFGLGCKAPFALVDDFEVTSYHDGKMSIYRLSKSNAEVGGKPSIIPVVSNVPSTEHGLMVKIAVKDREQMRRFETLIMRIVQNGAMLMKLNDAVLPTLPFNDMVHGFMLTKHKVLETYKKIVIRYGNVIYPIDDEETYTSQYASISQFIDRISGGSWNNRGSWCLVLQAAPNTVSVTPSRESLSNQKRTLDTIKQLMVDFLASRDKHLAKECFHLLEDRIGSVYIESIPAVLFNTEQRIPNIDRLGRTDSGVLLPHNKTYRFKDQMSLTSYPEFVRQYANTGYPNFNGFRDKDLMLRISTLIEAQFGGQKMQKLLRAFRTELKKDKYRPTRMKPGKQSHVTQEVHSPWFHQSVVWPLIKDMDAAGLKADKLMVFSSPSRGYSHNREMIQDLKSFHPSRLEDMLPFARNIVILSFNKMDVADGKASDYAICKYWLGDPDKALVYVVPRADQKVQAAREYFISKGVHLIDLTENQQRQYIQRQQEAKEQPEIKAKPKKAGIPKLSAMVDENGVFHNDQIEILARSDQEIERVKTPKFVIKDGRRNPVTEFESLTAGQTKILIEQYGSEGGFCVNQNQYDRYINQGAIPMIDYVLGELADEYETNLRIREYLPFNWARVEHNTWNSPYRSVYEWWKVIMSDRDLFEYLGVRDNRTEEDKKIMSLWEAFRGNYWRDKDSIAFNRIGKVHEVLPVNSIIKNIYENLKSSRLLKAFDCSECLSIIRYPESVLVTETQRLAIRDAILYAIEG